MLPVGMSQEQIAAIGAYPAGKGVLGELIRHPRPLRLREVSRHPAAYGFPPNHPPMHSFLGVPVRVREEVVGNFYLAGKRGGQEFDLEDEAVLQTLAVAAGVAMENARLYRKARKRLQLLYDAATRVGTTLDVVRTAEELTRVVVPGFADYTTVELLEAVLQGGEPSGTAEMHCTASCGVRQDAPLIPVGERITWLPATPMASALVSGHAVLEPDLGAAPGWQTQIPAARQITDYGIRSLITVPLQARGVVLGLVNFWRLEETEPFDQEDLSLAEELATRAAVCIDNARRYTREHGMAVTLQRSLLPQTMPAQNALDVAYRYAPAEAGVRGDWFDVIPLPGARVALVVGDVVGHGLHASATMGRLRTAVHNFSSLDLPPDELLGYLDELVARIDQDVIDQDVREGEPGITGATCLYAIYDPVPAQVTIARAGHLGPALVHPEGSVTFPEVPGSPPLGLGGSLPVETAKFQVPEGSRLVLFTDGLVEDRDRDIGAGLALLQRTLAEAPGRDPEQTCQAVFDALQAARPRDDTVLLVARTRVLDPGPG
ncbi:hypothetical protein GCM10009535_58440 [Streptomyces thermocarboxydovorans]|uniref:Uncharacterized protein n=1 Tax=Streptomyces thermocarboxydovorans TaxID=59298 RepID=A0ABP3SZL5_9ACTN